MIGTRTLMKRVSVIFPFVIAAAFLISSQATAREFSQQKVVNFDWKQFGKKAIDRADYYKEEDHEFHRRKSEIHCAGGRQTTKCNACYA